MFEGRNWKRVLVGLALAGLLAATGASLVAQDEDWHITADVAESCSCDVTCPCNFGSSPTHDYCHGNRLYQITKGHHGDTDVSGLELMVTFSMGEWAKLYVTDGATDEQMAALERLTPHFLGGFQRAGILSTERVPLTVERTVDKLKFRVPESSVEMDVMKGYGGKPVTVSNLPSATFQQYTQYKSVDHRHKSEQAEFQYSGTTGFTSKLDVGSK
jgi:hypothetical protein